MDSSNSQSPHTLTDEQMAILVIVVLEEFGEADTQAIQRGDACQL